MGDPWVFLFKRIFDWPLTCILNLKKHLIKLLLTQNQNESKKNVFLP